MRWTAPFRSAWSRIRRLSKPLLATLALVALGAAGAAAFYGYRTYDYVQHDNDFCLSCHLMVQPYEAFAQSAHRDLGCKACHRPTPVARSKMALTQILMNPEAIETHAEVPNEVCEECHVQGDPEQWRIVASSAGHRLHFESDDPKLAGLKCVECHSTSVHEFAAADRTCAQSGCHENTQIKLGRMSDLSLHCAVCHEFSRPVPAAVTGDSLNAAMHPRAQECLSCHAMRERVGVMPANDPHDAVCSSCHNPHTQSTPAEAVQQCTTCHTAADTISPMHRGIANHALQQCTTCHKAHEFRLEGASCIDCHGNIYDDATAAAATPAPASGRASFVHLVRSVAQQQPDTSRFRHARHRQLQCEACHETQQSHGTLKVTTARQCQSCHHQGADAARCATCHQPGDYMNVTARRPQAFRMSVGNRNRTLDFSHRGHERVSCITCHADPQTRAPTAAGCSACHEQHHQPDQSCRSCHGTAPPNVHRPSVVHVTCAGSGCHSQLPAGVRSIPRTREFCLVCHQAMVRHEPQKNCADCHALPRPRSAGLMHPAAAAAGVAP